VEAINSAPEFMMGKQLILSRKSVDKARLVDRSVPMKSCVLDP
jgi:3-phenylpropionate/trans-cinnamate dioxygenase ferredoxin reductase subunit